MGKPANLRKEKFGRKTSSSESASSDEEQAELSTARKRLLRRLEKENKAKEDALRAKMTSAKVKSGLGAAMDAENPKTREQESDQGSESEPDTGISDKQKEDDGNQAVTYVARKTQTLLADLDQSTVATWGNNLESNKWMTEKPSQYVARSVGNTLDLMQSTAEVAEKACLRAFAEPERGSWRDFDTKTLLHWLSLITCKGSETSASAFPQKVVDTLVSKYADQGVFSSMLHIAKQTSKVLTMLEEETPSEETQERTKIALLEALESHKFAPIAELGKIVRSKAKQAEASHGRKEGRLSLKELISLFMKEYQVTVNVYVQAEERKLLGVGSTGSSKSEKPEKPMNPNPWNGQGKRDRQPDGKNRQDKNGRNDKRQKTGDKAGSCKGCGRSPHPDGKCPFLVFGHPDANKSEKAWDKSDSGIAWLKKDNRTACPYNYTLSGDPFNMLMAYGDAYKCTKYCS